MSDRQLSSFLPHVIKKSLVLAAGVTHTWYKHSSVPRLIIDYGWASGELGRCRFSGSEISPVVQSTN